MRLLAGALAALIALARPACAVFADEAYNVDYHHALIGLPLANSTFFARPHSASKGSLLFSLSEQAVLGAVNPKDGALVWRQLLGNNATEARGLSKILRGDQYQMVAAAVGNQVSVWQASEGKLAWQKTFGAGDVVKDVQLLEPSWPVQDGPVSDVAVLVQQGSSMSVLRLDGNTGKQIWAYGDTTGEVPFRLGASAKGLHFLSLSKALLKGYKIKTTLLDWQSGSAGETITLSSENEITNPDDDILHVGTAPVPVVAWTDASRSLVKVNVLGSKNAITLDPHSKGVEAVTIQTPSKESVAPHFLVSYHTAQHHWAEVYHVEPNKGTVQKAYELPKLDGSGAFAVSTLDGDVYFTRTTETESTLFSSASDRILGQTPVAVGFDLPGLQGNEVPRPLSVASEVVKRADKTFAVRSAVVLSTGDWALARTGAVEWVRHESLAGIVEASFGRWKTETLKAVEAEIVKEERLDPLAAFVHRIKRHAQLLADLPDVLPQLPQQVLAWAEAIVTPGSYDAVKDATFGFNQLVIVLTASDRLIALEATKGRVVFNHPSSDCPGNLAARVACAQANTPAAALELAVPPRAPDANPRGHIAYATTPQGLVGVQKHAPAADRELWTFEPLAGQHVIHVAHRLEHEPVASIGKALADRRVLYKYLDPNAIVVTAVNAAAHQASFYVVDAVSGAQLYAAHHEHVDTARPLTSLISENWFAYSFTGIPAADTLPAGAQLVVGELYEADVPNDRGPLGAAANFSTADPAYAGQPTLPHVVAQAFVIPAELRAMAVSQTLQGITSRMLLVSTGTAVVGLPRPVLDPRRTLGKAPSPAQQADEGLTQYFPFLDFAPQWHLSHRRSVLADAILTVPSLMESTSLVFAHGLDVFGTRVSPSFAFDILGHNFNKVQLGLTIVALLGGVVGVAPIVGRKSVNALWTTPT